jgi:hypothetical protein
VQGAPPQPETAVSTPPKESARSRLPPPPSPRASSSYVLWKTTPLELTDVPPNFATLLTAPGKAARGSPLVGRKCRPPLLATRLPSSLLISSHKNIQLKTSIFQSVAGHRRGASPTAALLTRSATLRNTPRRFFAMVARRSVALGDGLATLCQTAQSFARERVRERRQARRDRRQARRDRRQSAARPSLEIGQSIKDE